MAIKECSEERYDRMLGILPPTVWVGKGFLVGESHDHRKCKITGKTAPTYAAFFAAFGKYYEGDPINAQTALGYVQGRFCCSRVKTSLQDTRPV